MFASPSDAALSNVQHRRKQTLFLALVVGLAVTLATQSSWPVDQPAHTAIEWVGLAMILASIAGRAWTSAFIGGRKRREIVAIGPYSVMRNPLYVLSIVGATGVGLQSGSIVVGAMAGLFCLLVFSLVVRREEAYLLHRFGEAFRAYCSRVPRWIPRRKGWILPAVVEFRPDLVWSTARDTMLLLIALPILELVEYLQSLDILPIYFHLP